MSRAMAAAGLFAAAWCASTVLVCTWACHRAETASAEIVSAHAHYLRPECALEGGPCEHGRARAYVQAGNSRSRQELTVAPARKCPSPSPTCCFI